ncbi:cation:proton antiporter [Colwellia sp. M166]|uniref:monovalent cation/H+ antiporter complex subunit F n=1 Tax=Colwellia sp. M166 TaxID=2583805 RepID=UPI00211E8495|nr:monovalent cation/H+ antiporter complex subunit F [Colwellia sp. M166]UUO25159.1 cation:proton antiporter [Colwellia sp. M166]|tara:strand:+ start:9374 stop:9667 length:294 start_codon:yes stop_codon:yes gene_type:complete
MLIAATLAIFVAMILAIIRGIAGPTLYDRILAVNMFGTKTVLLISLLGFVMGRPEFLDIAIVYALINFISVIGVLRYSDTNQFKHAPNDNESIEKEL